MSDRTKHQQLGAQDAQFVYSQTPSNLTHVMSVSVYEPPGGRRPYDFFGRVVNAGTSTQDNAPAANNLSGMSVRLGTDMTEPLERLAAIRRSTASVKAAESGVGARMLTEITQLIPSAGMAGLSRLMANESFAPIFCNLFISNVPGSPVPLYMAGARCTHQYGLAPIGTGMGLFIAVGSYQGDLGFNIISDKNIIPDMPFFRECLRTSQRALLAAARDHQ